ncbi:DUF3592 domain-containing protein [Streptomyces rapamycinicus]|uniref:DUF3592 domain-containing protein n=2 Tax=Streptomyces rapamycinicus TaxID=1226757 RepID=A0A0A0NS63_STRRN|nr:DUF3592 domain-containing protein [Streptomyces rapamycinicus]AGP57430.1 hypothetical protein M271_29940 [Streptomyces rapamycinicus NRRL 5491]MBB4785086.1 hypothetical protein [Streptomyces rapamycinicus]RLV79439.1 hypothetical protein D3C57_113680 [Streptomyces rapamycinicus NRRL 5491]UTO65308.1 DUF3592 domain-containing protein [Streptomyces rapamycinicus]UTP33264.1 DUF3592 domain-containing protein [Streptomyces rapamycinicus NRRL 5491]
MAMPGADLLCVAVGLLLYVFAWRDTQLVRRLRRDGVRTEGVVVANIVNRRDRGTTQTPVIRFHDHQGYMVEFTTAVQGVGLGLATGRRVDVLYLPGESQKARVWMRRHILGPAVVLTLIGTIFLGFGLVIAFS